jgi:hypothetical protein
MTPRRLPGKNTLAGKPVATHIEIVLGLLSGISSTMIALRGFAVRTAVLAALGLVAFSGCGDDTGLSKRYAVSGKVTYKGAPVEKGTISFIPASAEGRPASGQIENGSYTLTTLSPNDGAIPAKYKVTVMAQEIDTTEMKEIAKGGQFHHDGAFAKAVKGAKSLVPSKYALAETSGLEREVKAQSNSFDFELVD